MFYMPACALCQNQFEMTEDDRVFLRKFEVPDPTYCPPCREQRRWSFRNERTLYPRTCDLCGKQMISIFAKDKPYIVYCAECVFSDKWSPSEYGRDFDFSRPFFPQFKELLLATPHIGRVANNNVNSEYVNGETDDKNCYLNFGGHWNEDCYYNTFALKCRDDVDNYWIWQSELCYECIDVFSSYQCYFSQNMHTCRECWFCFDCRNSEYCFGSYNLRGAKYQIFNKQYTKEEYEKRVFELTNDFAAIAKAREDARTHGLSYPRRYALHTQIENSFGNYLGRCNKVTDSYDIEDSENVRWTYIAGWLKDCMDLTCVARGEHSYEVQASIFFANCMFSTYTFAQSSFLEYCYGCQSSENLFGCVNINKGKYLILNKQYSKEEYTTLREKIIAHMKSTGEYGEFFPHQLSLYGYNETSASIYFPLTREKVLARGWNWYDGEHGTFGKETMQPEQIPDRIEDVPDDFIKQMLRCVECSRNYTVIKGELAFYRKNHLSIPRKCYECRHRARLALRNPHKLWHRSCMCKIATHAHRTAGACPNEFETTYAPERPEIIFCEACFNAEVL